MRSRLFGALALSAALLASHAGFAKDCRLTVYFGLDQSDLSAEMQNVLLSFLSHNPRANGVVIGHTDALGSQEYNMDLSKRRALTVVNFIEQYRANTVSLATDWRGKMNLVVNASGAEALNRRVEIYYHQCATVNALFPLPAELRGYQTPVSEGEAQPPGGGTSSASSGGGGSSASSSGSGGSSSASAGSGGTSASSSGSGGSASASAGSTGTSASSAGSGSAAGASAGSSGTSASSAGSGSSGSASAGTGGTSASSTGTGGGGSASAGGQGTSVSSSSSSGSYSASAGNGQTSVSSTGG